MFRGSCTTTPGKCLVESTAIAPDKSLPVSWDSEVSGCSCDGLQSESKHQSWIGSCRFNHPNVIMFREVLLTPNHVGLAMELAPNGDLFAKVRDAKGLPVSFHSLCSPALSIGRFPMVVCKVRCRGVAGLLSAMCLLYSAPVFRKTHLPQRERLASKGAKRLLTYWQGKPGHCHVRSTALTASSMSVATRCLKLSFCKGHCLTSPQGPSGWMATYTYCTFRSCAVLIYCLSAGERGAGHLSAAHFGCGLLPPHGCSQQGHQAGECSAWG